MRALCYNKWRGSEEAWMSDIAWITKLKLPVSTRLRFNIATTLFGRQQRCINVETTSCACWSGASPLSKTWHYQWYRVMEVAFIKMVKLFDFQLAISHIFKHFALTFLEWQKLVEQLHACVSTSSVGCGTISEEPQVNMIQAELFTAYWDISARN